MTATFSTGFYYRETKRSNRVANFTVECTDFDGETEVFEIMAANHEQAAAEATQLFDRDIYMMIINVFD